MYSSFYIRFIAKFTHNNTKKRRKFRLFQNSAKSSQNSEPFSHEFLTFRNFSFLNTLHRKSINLEHQNVISLIDSWQMTWNLTFKSSTINIQKKENSTNFSRI
jgi:hypothetical protein